MIREVILEATGQVSETAVTSGCSRDPGSSNYPADNVPSMSLAEVWSDAVDDTYWYCWPNKTLGGSGIILASFPAPPTLVLFNSVKIEAWWSYSQMGPNNWYFPADNAFGPRACLVVRNRAKTDNNYSAWHEITGAEIAEHNENINTGNGGYLGPLLQEWIMAAHPEGGPWTYDDLSAANFAAGIKVEAAPPAYIVDPGNSMFKIRVHKLRVTLTVEDLGGYVDNIRHASALMLRLMRRARNTVALRSFADRTVGSVGSRVYMSHPRGPSVLPGGWGRRRLERRPGMILKRTIYPETFKVEDEVFDLQAYACLAWAAYRIDCAWSPELQGLALLEKGGGYTHARAQDGWSPRPGDGSLMRVIEAYPNISYWGLAAQGGGDVAEALYNWDMMQTGWITVGSVGDFAATADTSVSLVEEQGYLSSCKLVYGAAGGRGGRGRILGTFPYNAGHYLHVRAIVRNTSVPVPATQNGEWYLERYNGGLPAPEYWDEANRIWTTTATYNAIPSDEPFGESVADAIPCDAPAASSNPTYSVGAGRFSGNLTSVTLHGAIVDVQYSTAGAGGSYGARTPLVVLDATITRVADVHRLVNSTTESAEVWSYTRGVAVAEVQPFWRAAVLPTNTVKPLLHAYHAAATWDALQFVAKTGSDDLIRFERAVSGEATFQLDCPIPSLDLTRAHILRVWARWLGADGWKQYGPWSVEVGFAAFLESDGSLVKTGSVVGALAYQGNVATRSWLGIGNDDAGRHADAYIRMIEVRRNPISGLEALWRV